MEICEETDTGIAKAIAILEKGGVVAHATETCYGLACDLTNQDAVRRLFELKRRPNHMPMSALFSSVEEAKKYVEWNDTAEKLAKKHLPGPLTIILPRKTGKGTLGIRVSSFPLAQTLARRFGKPLSTTSANIHGEPDPYAPEEISVKPDLVLDSGPLPHNKPSTVLDLTQGDIRIIRGNFPLSAKS